MIVGERLRQIREHKNLSQGDIEHKTGLLRCYISRVENGHTVPSIETLEKLAKALEISMGQLFAGDGKEPKPLVLPAASPAAKSARLDRTTQNGLRRLTDAFVQMGKGEKVILIGIAQKLARRSAD
jgi:transcriptional regulator with XRE-family HTH domain